MTAIGVVSSLGVKLRGATLPDKTGHTLKLYSVVDLSENAVSTGK